MKNRSIERRSKEKEAGRTSNGSLKEDLADKAIGSAGLSKLSTADLYNLLQLKNIPGRSKITKKADRVKTLDGMIRASDLEQAGIALPPGLNAGYVPIYTTDTPFYIKEYREIQEMLQPGSGNRINEPVAGVDVHLDTLVYAIAGPRGVIKQGLVANDQEGIEALAMVFKQHGALHVALESTAEYWLKLYWGLRERGVYVLLANPRQTKDTQGKKTDRHDARRIAIAFRDGRLAPSVLCSPEQFERRKMNRDAIKWKDQATKHVNAFKVIFHRLDAPTWIEDLRKSKRGCRILSKMKSNISRDEVLAMVTDEYSRYKGKTDDPVILVQKTDDLFQLFRAMAKVPGLELRFHQHFDAYLRCRQMARELQLKILQGVASDSKFLENMELLLTCPGVGVTTALSILIELVDITFFSSPKCLSRWAGLAPRVNQSGHNKRSNGHIHKAGNKWLRRATWLAAKAGYNHHAKGSHPVGAFIKRLRDAGKAYKVAVTAGARQLLVVIYHVLQARRPFHDVYAQLESDTQQRNRQRKLKKLKRLMKEASLADLLEIAASTIPRRCAAMMDVEQEYARVLHNALGVQLEFADFG